MTMSSSETANLQARLGRLEGYLREDRDNLGLLDECGELAFRLGKLQEARTRAERALSLAPGDPRFLFRLADVCIAERRLDEAERILSSLKDAGTELPVVCYNLAYVQVLKRNYPEAAALLRGILAQPGCPPEAETLLMRSLHGAGQIEEALEIAQRRLQGDPADGKAMGIASLLYLDKGDMEQAGSLAAQALETEPENMEALVTHGSVALAKERPRDARRDFERALALNPRDGRAWSGLALSDMFALDLPRAYAGFRKAVANMPDHVGTWHALAWCQILMKDLEGAAATFEHALSLDRNFAESHGGRAVVAALQHRNDAAKESAAIALRLDPACLSARYAQAILSGEIKDSASFRRFAEQVLQGQAAPGGGDMRAALARMQRTINRSRLPRK
jgi:Flp pilus assembly protein TadD